MSRRFRTRLSATLLEDRWTPAAGDLDLSFGTNGRASFTFPGGTFAPADAVALPDGSTFVGGTFAVNGATRADGAGLAAVRLTPGGQLDRTFGTNGLATVGFDAAVAPRSVGILDSVAVAPDGRLLLAGRVSGNGVDPYPAKAGTMVVRLTADGRLDSTFGSGGVVQPRELEAVADMAVYSDGRVLAAGYTDGQYSVPGPQLYNTRTVAAAVRLTAAGAVDAAFNGGRPVLLPAGERGSSGASAAAVLADGRAVLAGSFGTSDADPNPAAAVRLLADGSLDPTFGSGSRAALQLPAPADGRRIRFGIDGLAVRPDGEVALSAVDTIQPSGSTDPFRTVRVARLRADGSPDPTFSGDGVATPAGVGPGTLATVVSFTLDGGVAVASGGRLVRLAADGSERTAPASVQTYGPVAALSPNGQAVLVGADGTNAVRLQGDPRPGAGSLLVGGSPDGTARLLTPGGDPAGTAVQAFPNFAGTARTATADVTGDGVPDFVVGAGPGGGPNVQIFDGVTGAKFANLDVFEQSFSGGVFVAAADLNGDGKAEVVVTPDQGGGPVVAIFDGAGLAAGQDNAAQLVRFFGIDDAAFRGGARPALGDVNGDGRPDLVVAAGFGGGPRVALFDGAAVTDPSRYVAGGFVTVGTARGIPLTEPRSVPPKLVGDFFVFEDTLRNGVFVSAGDLNNDGAAEVVVGGGPGGGPRVLALDGRELVGGRQTPVANFFAGDEASRGGVRVAVRPGADGQPRLVTGSGDGEAAAVRVYTAGVASNPTAPPEQTLSPFGGAALANGVFVG